MSSAAARLELICKHLQTSTPVNPACGIVAVVSNDQNVTPMVMEGLKILQNRGYDSAGIASVDQGQLHLEKFASEFSTNDALERLERQVEFLPGNVALGHTRWATHGNRTDINAHPHRSNSGRLVLIHNGILENAEEIKADLLKEGVIFTSQTDTEVIVQYLEFLMIRESIEIQEAYDLATRRMLGTWGLVVLDLHHPNQLFVASKGSPLLIGLGDETLFVASETAAFNRYVKEYIALSNGESALLTPKGHSLRSVDILKLAPEQILLSPAPFPHWTLREIHEQPRAIQHSMSNGGRILNSGMVKLGGLESHQEQLLRIRHLIISGCGTSLYAAKYGARLMRMLKSFESVRVIDAAELTPEDFLKDSGLLVISQSGETKDVHRCMMIASEHEIPVFSIVNQVGSLIARTALCGTYIQAGRENGVASTKSFMCQVVVLSMMSIWFAQKRGIALSARQSLISSLQRLPSVVANILKYDQVYRTLAQTILKTGHKSLFILGKGLSQEIALEGALKMKEISYLHVEGFSGGALKHGPYALIQEGTPVIILKMDDQHRSLMNVAVSEIKSRGANVFTISDLIEPDNITIPTNGLLSSLSAVVVLQLISYYLSVEQQINPDAPRNLAKAVTVD